MSVENEKLERFSSAVSEEVQRQIDSILSDAQTSRDEIIEKAHDTSLYIAYDKIKDEMKKISNKYLRLVSQAELESKRDILVHRENLAKKVFLNITDKLVAFTKDEKYKDYLLAKISNEIKSLPESDDAVIYLSSNDYKFTDDLKAITDIKVEENSLIKIGGFMIHLKDKNLIIDKTMDLSLEEERQKFNQSDCLRLN